MVISILPIDNSRVRFCAKKGESREDVPFAAIQTEVTCSAALPTMGSKMSPMKASNEKESDRAKLEERRQREANLWGYCNLERIDR